MDCRTKFTAGWLMVLLLLAICDLVGAAFPKWAPNMAPDKQALVQKAFVEAMGLARLTALTWDSECYGVSTKPFPPTSSTSNPDRSG
jgi:hypothetical protein